MKKHFILLFFIIISISYKAYPASEVYCDLKVQKKFLQSTVYEISFKVPKASECITKLPLNTGKEFDLSQSVGMSFEIKGEKDVQEFIVGLEAEGPTRYLSNIIEYLPLSVIDQWKQTGLLTQEMKNKGLDLKKIKYLVLKFHKAGKGTLYFKNFKKIPLLHNTTRFETVLFPLYEYGLQNKNEIGIISAGFYGDAGWKIGNVYKKENKVEFSKIDLKSEKPKTDKNYFVVSDFNQGNQNYLGGFFNEFFARPSYSRVTVTDTEKRGEGKSLYIEYDQKLIGFSGAWIHLFNFKKPPEERTYFNAEDFKYLSFWVKGREGGEDIFVQLADARWEHKEDSVIVGRVKDFLPKGITKEWQQVLLPLNQTQLGVLDIQKLAGLIFNFRFPGKGLIYIDDVAFLKNKEAQVPPTHHFQKIEKKKIRNAMWIWDTMKQLENSEEQKKLLEFSKRNNIHIIFWQLQYDIFKNNETYSIKLKKEEELRKFIALATQEGISIEALDGFSRFALKPWHPLVLEEIREILAYNNRVKKEERFSGIHHDNEPYLIPTFWGRVNEQAMREYLELCEASQKLVKESGQNIEYGVDIPFWYEERNFDFKVPVEMRWKGVKKPASFHIIDTVDNVGIMDYRTKAYGADGTIIHGIDEMEYAEKVHKSIYIGLETFYLPDENFAVFDFKKKLILRKEGVSKNGESLPHNGADEGYKILRDKYYLILDQFEGLGILYIRRLQENEKFKDMLNDIVALYPQHHMIPSHIAVVVPGNKLSFYGMKKDYFLEIVDKNHEFFSPYKSFRGFAFHFYETLKELLESQ
ncbi:MAG: hypothetical protein HYW47_04695 [Deltaproteobacteria bacterium]|nr:hypothetical protein [Deltaproteobacteria bacterium]